MVDQDGKVDRTRLEEALGGKTKDTDHFVRELHLARAAIALRRKALIADAAAHALADPGNQYKALRKHLDGQAREVEQADAAKAELTEQLMRVELKGPWHAKKAGLAERQDQLRRQIAPPAVDDTAEVLYLATASGDVLQLLPADDGEPEEAPVDEAGEPASD